MTAKQLAQDYADYIAKHGREPDVLKCGQAEYLNIVEGECSVDWDTGTDVRYQGTMVMVVDGMSGWIFE